MARNNDHTGLALVAEVMEAGAESKPFKGKSFSITGHLGQPRAKIVQLIEQAGGRFDESPKWGTTYLITNLDWTAGTVKGSASKKLQAAKDNRVTIISEAKFFEMLAPDLQG